MTLSEHPVARRRVLQGSAVVGAAAALPAITAGATPGTSIALAVNGKAKYSIIYGHNPSPVILQAANELASYLKQMCGATFTVKSSNAAGGPVIALGADTAVAQHPNMSVSISGLGEDGFALRTNNKSVLIAGVNERGTLYGVYWLLDRILGVRWFDPTYTVVPQKSTITIPEADLNGDHIPHFRYRNLLGGDFNDPAYRQHALLNGLRDQYWSEPTPPGLNTWSHYWPEEIGAAGTFHSIVSDQQWWHGGQLLCMEEGTRAAAASSLVAKINQRIAGGQDASYPFFQEDTGWSPDPDSQAFADAHGGTLSAPVIDMCNDVIARVRADIPSARIETQGYWWGIKPPVAMTVDPNIVMTIAPIEGNWADSVVTADPNFADHIDKWNQVSQHNVFWDYGVSFSDYLCPYPNWWSVPRGIKELAALPNYTGYFSEHANNDKGIPFSFLHAWVESRLLWDPSLDIDSLITEFCQGYYGPAGSDVEAYMRLLVASVQQVGASVNIRLTTESATFLTASVLLQADAIMSAAATKVAANNTFRKHLLVARAGLERAILYRRDELAYVAAQTGVSFTKDTQNRIARIKEAYQVSGMTVIELNQGGTDNDLLWLEYERSYPPTLPAGVVGLPASDWVDYQDTRFFKYPPQTLPVVDPAASDGLAVSIPGDAPTWGIQLPLSTLPKDGHWKVHISIKAGPHSNPAPTSGGVGLGVYPDLPGITETSFQFSELADGLYHDLEWPGTYSFDATTRYLYVNGPVNPALQYLYVDRIYAVRV